MRFSYAISLLALHNHDNAPPSIVSAFSAPKLSYSRKATRASDGNRLFSSTSNDDANSYANADDVRLVRENDDGHDVKEDDDDAATRRRRLAVAAGVLSAQQFHLPKAFAEGSVGLAGLIATTLVAGEDVGAAAVDIPKEAIIELTSSTGSPSTSIVVDKDSTTTAVAPETRPASAISDLVSEATSALAEGETTKVVVKDLPAPVSVSASAEPTSAAATPESPPAKDVTKPPIEATSAQASVETKEPTLDSAESVVPPPPSLPTKEKMITTIEAANSNIGKEAHSIEMEVAKLKAAEAQEKAAKAAEKAAALKAKMEAENEAIEKALKESTGTKGMTEIGKEMVTKDLGLLAVPGLILVGIVGTASSFLTGDKSNNDDDDTKDASTETGEGSKGWKYDKPVPYGLQKSTPGYSFPSTDAEVDVQEPVPQMEKKPIEPTASVMKEKQMEKKPVEPNAAGMKDTSLPDALKKAQEATSSLKGSSSSQPAGTTSSQPKSTTTTKNISMANIMKGTTQVQTDKPEKEWKFEAPTPYGLQKGTPKSAPSEFASKKKSAKGTTGTLKKKFTTPGQAKLERKSFGVVDVMKGSSVVDGSDAESVPAPAKKVTGDSVVQTGATTDTGSPSISISNSGSSLGSRGSAAAGGGMMKGSATSAQPGPKSGGFKKSSWKATSKSGPGAGTEKKKGLGRKSISMVNIMKGKDDSAGVVKTQTNDAAKIAGDSIVETRATTSSSPSASSSATGLGGGGMMKGSATSTQAAPKAGGFKKSSWKATAKSGPGAGADTKKGLGRKSISMVNIMKEGKASAAGSDAGDASVAMKGKDVSGETTKSLSERAKPEASTATPVTSTSSSAAAGGGTTKGSTTPAQAAPKSKSGGFGKGSWKSNSGPAEMKKGLGRKSISMVNIMKGGDGAGSSAPASNAAVDTGASAGKQGEAGPGAGGGGGMGMMKGQTAEAAVPKSKAFGKASWKASTKTTDTGSAGPISAQGGGMGGAAATADSSGISKSSVAGASQPANGTLKGQTGAPKSFAKSAPKKYVSDLKSKIGIPSQPVVGSAAAPASKAAAPLPKKGFGKSAGAYPSGAGGMLKGTSSVASARPQGFGAKKSPSFGKAASTTTASSNKGFGSPVPGFGMGGSGKGSTKKEGGSGPGEMVKGRFLSNLEQASVPETTSSPPVSSPMAASSVPLTSAAAPVPSPPAPAEEVSSPGGQAATEITGQQQQVQQQQSRQQVTPQSIGQFGSNTARDAVRNNPGSPGSAATSRTGPLASSPGGNTVQNARLADKQSTGGSRGAEPVASMEGGEKKPPLSVTVTDPRTGKKRTISVSSRE